MGSGQSASSYQNVILNTTAQLISKTLQEASTNLIQEQVLVVECEEFTKTLKKAQSDCHERFKNRPPDEIIQICNVNDGLKCGANDIVLTQSLVFDADLAQNSTVAQSVGQNLEAKLNTAIQSNTGFLRFGDKTKSSVQAYAEQVAQLWTSNAQKALLDSIQSQTVETKSGPVSVIRLDQAQNTIVKFLQQNETLQSVVQDLSVQIKTDIDSGGASLGPWQIALIVIGVVAGLLLIGYLISLAF